MKRTPVKTGNKTFHHFPGDQFEIIEFLKLLDIA
jgi:hypothetical protein